MAARLIALSEITFFDVDDVTQRILDKIIDFETNTWSVYLCTKRTTPSQAMWISSHHYAEGDKILANPDNGHRYICTQAGTTGVKAPTFPTESGETVTDNQVTWQENGGSMSGWKTIDWPKKSQLAKETGYSPKTATVTNSGTDESPQINIEQVTFSDIDAPNVNYAFVANQDDQVLGYAQIGEASTGIGLGMCDLQFTVDQNYALMQANIRKCRVKRTTLNPSPMLNNTMSRYCNPQQGKHHYKGDQPELRIWDPGNPRTQPNCKCTFVDVGPPVIIDPELTIDAGNYEYHAKCGPAPHHWELAGPDGIDVTQWVTIISEYYEKESDLMDSETPEHVCILHADDASGVAFTLTVIDGDGAQDSIDINTELEPVIVIRYEDQTKAYFSINLNSGATAETDNSGLIDLETLGVVPNKDSRFYCGVDKDGNQYFLCGKPFYWLATGYKEWYSEDYGYNFSYNFDVAIDKQLTARCFAELRAPTDPDIFPFVGDSFHTLEFYAIKLSNQASAIYFPSFYANQSQDMQLRTTQVDSVYFADESVEVIECEYRYDNRNDPYDDDTNGPDTWFPALVHAPYYRKYGYDGAVQLSIDMLSVMEASIAGFSSNDAPYYQIGSIRRTSATVFELTIYKNDEYGSAPYVTTYIYQWTIGAATATLSETIPNADTTIGTYIENGREGYYLWPIHSKLSVEGYQASRALDYEIFEDSKWEALGHSRSQAKMIVDGSEHDPSGFTTKCSGVQVMWQPDETDQQGCAVWFTTSSGLMPDWNDHQQWPQPRNLFPMFHDVDNDILVYGTGVCNYWQNYYGDPATWQSSWMRFKNQYWLKIGSTVFQLGFLPGQETNDDPIQAYFIQRHNEIRAAAGKGALKYYVKIYDAAQGHSDDMALNNFFDHIGSDSHDVFWRLTQQHFDFTDYGENIHMRGSLDYTGDAATDLTEAEIDSIMQDFVDSPEHYANLLDEDFDLCGIGYAYSSEDQKWYITVNFTNEQLEMVESEYNYFRYHNDDPELDKWDYWCSGTAITDMSFSVVDNYLTISYLVARIEKKQVEYTPGAAAWTTHEKVETPDKRIFAIYDIAAKELLWRGEIEGVTLDTRLTAGFIPATLGDE